MGAHFASNKSNSFSIVNNYVCFTFSHLADVLIQSFTLHEEMTLISTTIEDPATEIVLYLLFARYSK